MLSEKDICIVIPTYKRAEDVDHSLKVLYELKKKESVAGKIILVDQTKTPETKDVVKKWSKKLPVQYIFSNIPSSSIAENIGVREAKKRFPLILIVGDDVDFLSGYFKEMVKVFEDPKVMGVAGVDKEAGAARHTTKSLLASLFLRIFYLPFNEDHKFRVRGPYGTTASPIVTHDVKDAQWIPGFNNCFRKEVYEEYSFPEIKGYNVLEDVDCSYKVYKKNGVGSLVITPKCKVWHRESKAARYPERKRIFVNHEDHFAFYYRNFYTFTGTVKLVWAHVGIAIGNFLRFLGNPSKESFVNFGNNVDAIIFCYKNKKNIKEGNFRVFLNDDLSMKNFK